MKIQLERRWMLSSILGGFCLIGIAALLFEFAGDPAAIRPTILEIVPKTPPATAAQSTKIGEIDTYAEIIARPVFSRTRRPDPPKVGPDPAGKVAEARPTPPTLPHYALIGIIIDKDRRIVMLKDPAGVAISASPGEALGSWTIEKIDSNRLILKYADTMQELTFPAPDPTVKGQGANRAIPAPPILPSNR